MTADGALGFRSGDLVVVTEPDAERLHGLPTGMLLARHVDPTGRVTDEPLRRGPS